MANKNERKKVKLGATRILCGILAGLMVIGSIATIVVTLINC